MLGPTDVDDAATVLARAFADEPSKLAFLPDARDRLHFTRGVATGRLRATIPYATAFGLERDGALAGVAVWHPPAVTPSTGAAAGAMLRALFAPGRRAYPTLRRVARTLWDDRAALRRLAANRSAGARLARRGQSWYLALLGTDPRHRGQGVARELLEHVLGRCDVEGLGAWTEATNAGNVAMYERFGFSPVAHGRGGAVIPDLWILRREPRAPAAR